MSSGGDYNKSTHAKDVKVNYNSTEASITSTLTKNDDPTNVTNGSNITQVTKVDLNATVASHHKKLPTAISETTQIHKYSLRTTVSKSNQITMSKNTGSKNLFIVTKSPNISKYMKENITTISDWSPKDENVPNIVAISFVISYMILTISITILLAICLLIVRTIYKEKSVNENGEIIDTALSEQGSVKKDTKLTLKSYEAIDPYPHDRFGTSLQKRRYFGENYEEEKQLHAQQSAHEMEHHNKITMTNKDDIIDNKKMKPRENGGGRKCERSQDEREMEPNVKHHHKMNYRP